MSEGPCGMDTESCRGVADCETCKNAPKAAVPEYSLQAPISKRCSVAGCKSTARGKKGLCPKHERWSRRHPGQPIPLAIGGKGRPPKGSAALVRTPGLHLEPWALAEAKHAANQARIPVGELLRRWVQTAAGNARAAREASAGNPGKAPPSAPAGEIGPQTASAAPRGLPGS